ncbi:ArsR/SmtB family transcription factor [Photobacterium lutimaris]|uniref:Transcriptional regulator n=1 Tax=Photobacterium lutimaris TaxID=388278 RepID=A0A2T3J4B7_9GAMM|nr:helix-turn-helix domain-containing protein [Photobacterium lutimaris]PSU36147.1 transcriptional regulator [Photobacterium lutimaris]TDR79255.1 ArsR family transcriptional regulator [Photobacterium lutimaris]
MNRDEATTIFDSLSSGVRLDAWRLLVKAGNEGKVAGEMAKEMGVAPNSLSFHLKAMLHAGLVSVEQQGRFQRYRANIPVMMALIAYLTEECCGDDTEASCHPSQASSMCSTAKSQVNP